jgi:hypothetical protein
LTAKRRETKRICVAFADAWVLTCSFLRQAMSIVLEADLPSVQSESDVLRQLEEWIKVNGEKELNGEVEDEEEAKDDTDKLMKVSEGTEGEPAALTNGHSGTFDNEHDRVVENGTSSETKSQIGTLPVPAPAVVRIPDMNPVPVHHPTPESNLEPTLETTIESPTRINDEPVVEPALEPPVDLAAPLSPKNISAELAPAIVDQPGVDTSPTVEIHENPSVVQGTAAIETSVRRDSDVSPKTNRVNVKPEQVSEEEVVDPAPSPAAPGEEPQILAGTPSAEPVVPEEVIGTLPVQTTADDTVELSAETTEPDSAIPKLAEPVATPSVSADISDSEPVGVEKMERPQSHATDDATITPWTGATESTSAEDTPALAEQIEIPSDPTTIKESEPIVAEAAPELLETKEEAVEASPDAPNSLAATDTPIQAALPISVTAEEVNAVSGTAPLPAGHQDPSTSIIHPEGQDPIAGSGTATPAEDEEVADSGTVTPLGDQPNQEAGTAPKANKKKKKKGKK